MIPLSCKIDYFPTRLCIKAGSFLSLLLVVFIPKLEAARSAARFSITSQRFEFCFTDNAFIFVWFFHIPSVVLPSIF